MGLRSCVLKLTLVPLTLFLLLAYSPGLLDITPVHLEILDSRPFIGSLAPNRKLENAEKLLNNNIHGPESITFYKGDLYTGLQNGWIVRIKNDRNIEPLAIIGDKNCEPWEEERCGRPLGLRFDQNGALYVMDGYYGLHKVNIHTGKVTPIFHSSEPIDGERALIPNHFDISSTGDIYFSDSSRKWQLKEGMYEILESAPNGRVIHFDRKANRTRTIIDGLVFPNGVQLSPKEDMLIIAETSRNRLLKYHLKGDKKGQVEVFIDNLPGAPDNIRPNGRGGYWIPMCVITEGGALQRLGPHEIVRKVVARAIYVVRTVVQYLDSWSPSSGLKMLNYKLAHMAPYISFEPRYGLVLEIDGDGQIIRSLHAPDGSITFISEATEQGNELYLGSPWNPYIGKVTL